MSCCNQVIWRAIFIIALCRYFKIGTATIYFGEGPVSLSAVMAVTAILQSPTNIFAKKLPIWLFRGAPQYFKGNYLYSFLELGMCSDPISKGQIFMNDLFFKSSFFKQCNPFADNIGHQSIAISWPHNRAKNCLLPNLRASKDHLHLSSINPPWIF